MDYIGSHSLRHPDRRPSRRTSCAGPTSTRTPATSRSGRSRKGGSRRRRRTRRPARRSRPGCGSTCSRRSGRCRSATIRPSTVQAWLRGRQQACAPSTVRVLLANLSAILGAAVADGLLATNPCASSSSVRAPRLDRPGWCRGPASRSRRSSPRHRRGTRRCRSRPPAAGSVRARRSAWTSTPWTSSAGGSSSVSRSSRFIGRLVLAPPKGGRTREVPLPDVVAVALAEHLRRFPAREVACRGGSQTGAAPGAPAVHDPARDRDQPQPLQPVRVEAGAPRGGVDPSRANGYHALRHHYASVLLDGGVSIRALAEYLGHADPGFTLRWYDEQLAHPDGRAQGGEPCVQCGEPIAPHAHPKQRDRHVCSPRCNANYKRRMKRKWQREGPPVLPPPKIDPHPDRPPLVFGTDLHAPFPYGFLGPSPRSGDIVERHGTVITYLQPDFPADVVDLAARNAERFPRQPRRRGQVAHGDPGARMLPRTHRDHLHGNGRRVGLREPRGHRPLTAGRYAAC
jgi:hypothetical protein